MNASGGTALILLRSLIRAPPHFKCSPTEDLMEYTNPYRAPATGSTRADDDTVLPNSRWTVFAWSVAYFYPLIATACFYSSWLLAWVCLGHMPRPMLDDPKFIGGVMDFAYLLSMFALVSLPVLTPICFASSFFCPLRFVRNRVNKAAIFAIAYIAVAVGLFLLLRLDPGHVVEWLFD